MKLDMFRTLMLGAVITTLSLAGCKKDNAGIENPPVEEERLITISGSQDDPSNATIGDGNLAVKLYSVSVAEAKIQTLPLMYS